MATIVASGWLVAAIPFCAMTSDLVAKLFPIDRSWLMEMLVAIRITSMEYMYLIIVFQFAFKDMGI
jgi:hypothetical protein